MDDPFPRRSLVLFWKLGERIEFNAVVEGCLRDALQVLAESLSARGILTNGSLGSPGAARSFSDE